jgi:putative ABC transport system permease protein
VSGLRAWLLRLGATLRPGRRERELADELESHLQLHIDECLRRGMSLEEARREARLRLGGVAQTAESVRDQGRLRGLESLVADLRFGARLIVKSPGFSAVAILTLALGIGANTAVFSVIHAVLLDPLPYRSPGELVVAGEGATPGRAQTTSYATFADWRARSRSFADLSIVRDWQPTLVGAGDAEQLLGARVSASFLRTLGVTPRLGRDFHPDEDTPATRKVVILGHDLWQRRFAGDPGIVGKPIALDSGSFTVVGVLPPGFRSLVAEATFGQPAELLAPLGYEASQPHACRTCRHVFVLGRLAGGTSAGEARAGRGGWGRGRGGGGRAGGAPRAELGALTAALWKEHPDAYGSADVTVVPLAEQLVGPVRPLLLVLLGGVGFVLLIACVNLAHLLLARAAAREREIAIRTALGASRGRVIRQLLCENCLLALLGAAAGLLPASFVPALLASFGPRTLPRLAEIGLDRTVLLFTLGLALLTGVLSGLVPALRMTGRNLHDALQGGGRAMTQTGSRRLVRVLVIAEVALSLTLLVGAGLMVRSVTRLLDVSPGFEPARVLTLRLSLVGPAYAEEPELARGFDPVLERLRGLPGVEAASMTSQLPLSGSFDGYGFHPEGRMAANPEQDPGVQRFVVAPGYGRVMGIPLLAGRPLEAGDRDGAPEVVLVSQSAAARAWPGEDPIGKRVKLGGLDGPWWTVVGVVGDVRHLQLDQPPPMAVYVPHAQWPSSQMILTVRAAGPPSDLAASVERAVRAAAPRQPVSRVTALEEVVASSVAGRRLALVMLGAFAAVALALSAIGIYGVTSYTVALRTRELGIRLALGARPAQLLAATLRSGLALAVAGIAAGLAIALALTRSLSSLLYGISATDPGTFAAGVALLGAIALVACWVPARRVLRVDPTEPLRDE